MPQEQKRTDKANILLTAVLVVVAAYFIPFGQMAPGSGNVVNSTTLAPISGARVSLECRRQFFGGSSVVRTVATTSDEDGIYQFSFLDVLGCSFGYLSAEKAGYLPAEAIHGGYGRTDYKNIPRQYFLTPEEDVVMLRLKAITPSQTGSVFRNGAYSAVGDYQVWYTAFFEAARIAHTDREKSLVRGSYCQTLDDLHALLSGRDEEYLSQLSISFNFKGTYASGKYDHGEVTAFCEDK